MILTPVKLVTGFSGSVYQFANERLSIEINDKKLVGLRLRG
jgi:hypothetical protein